MEVMSVTKNTHYLACGSTAAEPYGLVVTPETAGWAYSGLRTLELGGGEYVFDTGAEEMLVLPLSGSCTVVCDGETFELTGRKDVFSRVTDFAYVPRDATVRVRGSGRFALPVGAVRDTA